MRAETTVVTTVGASTGFVYLARLRSDPKDALTQPGAMLRIALGGSFVIVGLLILARPAPKVASTFGYLVLLGTTLTYGRRVAPLVTDAVQSAQAPERDGVSGVDKVERSAGAGGTGRAGGGGGGGSWGAPQSQNGVAQTGKFPTVRFRRE